MYSLNIKAILKKIVENWPAKVLSVVLAIILAVFHQMSTLGERSFSAPLKIEGNSSLIPSKPYDGVIRVTIRADDRSKDTIRDEDVEAYVDISKVKESGSYNLPVLVRKKGTAVGVEPLEISVNPPEVEIALDQKMTKSVPVTPNFRGYLESGYELVSYTLEPSQVDIEGPRDVISNASGLTTDYIELNGRKANFTTTSRILSTDPLMVIRGAGIVEVRGFIQELIMIRNFDNLPVTVTGLNSRFNARLNVSTGSIRIEGNLNSLEGYTPWGTILSLDCSNIEESGILTLPVTVAIPPQFTLIRYEPMEVTVIIEEKLGDPDQ